MLTTLYRRGYVSLSFMICLLTCLIMFVTINIMFIACNGVICNISMDSYCNTDIPNLVWFIIYIVSLIGTIIGTVLVYKRNLKMKQSYILAEQYLQEDTTYVQSDHHYMNFPNGDSPNSFKDLNSPNPHHNSASPRYPDGLDSSISLRYPDGLHNYPVNM